MRRHTRSPWIRALAALCLLSSLVAPGEVRAQDIAAAEALFNRGVEDMNAGRYETGCKAIAESHRIDPRPGTLFTLAHCEGLWGRVATAFTRYGDYLELFARLPQDRQALQGDRPRVAGEQREKLAPDVPWLTLVLPKGAPAGTGVLRDGDVVSEMTLGMALPADPGEHVLLTRTAGGEEREQRVTLKKGEKRVVTLELPMKAQGATGDDGRAPGGASGKAVGPGGSSGGRSLVGPLAAFGGAAAAFGVGVALGVVVLDKRSQLEKACPGGDCPASQQGNLEEAKALSHGSTAAFVVAGAGAAAGAVLLIVSPRGPDKRSRAAVRVGPGFLGVEGVF